MNDLNNLRNLSHGEHSLEEVLKLAQVPYVVDGKFCSKCNTELDVEMDEDWDEDGFVILPYLFCPKCNEKRENEN